MYGDRLARWANGMRAGRTALVCNSTLNGFRVCGNKASANLPHTFLLVIASASFITTQNIRIYGHECVLSNNTKRRQACSVKADTRTMADAVNFDADEAKVSI